MGAYTEGSDDPVGRPHVRLRVLKAFAFSGLVMLLAVLAFSVSQWRSVEAATFASQHSNATLTDPAGSRMELWVTALGVMAQGTMANYLVSLEAGEAARCGTTSGRERRPDQHGNGLVGNINRGHGYRFDHHLPGIFVRPNPGVRWPRCGNV